MTLNDDSRPPSPPDGVPVASPTAAAPTANKEKTGASQSTAARRSGRGNKRTVFLRPQRARLPAPALRDGERVRARRELGERGSCRREDGDELTPDETKGRERPTQLVRAREGEIRLDRLAVVDVRWSRVRGLQRGCTASRSRGEGFAEERRRRSLPRDGIVGRAGGGREGLEVVLAMEVDLRSGGVSRGLGGGVGEGVTHAELNAALLESPREAG